MDLQVSSQVSRSTRFPFHTNPDIFDEICDYLSYDYDFDADEISRSKQNLLWVALTCKAFLEPSLDRLWKQLDSLFPLLKVLPAFTQSDGTYVSRFLFLTVSI